MKGDFSNWRDERRQNFNGVLHQQGRVMLDADWNAQTAITNDWQDTAARDVIGPGVAAVPSDQPLGFKVTSASVVTGQVQLTVTPGRVWADGLLTELFNRPDPDVTGNVIRNATYLTPPVQTPGATTATLGPGIRDAVVLEVWREEINAFQLPSLLIEPAGPDTTERVHTSLLIEPALGGPDTTERVHTSMAFRLMRLAAGDTCENIRGRLRDRFDEKGKLRATLQPPTPGAGDCPTVAGGGYTGFEHNLYRIEIADVTAGAPPRFKWSKYGGGLVGRGRFVEGAPRTVNITANLQAIVNSGSTSFYVEAIKYDESLGRWRVTYGARASLTANDGVLTFLEEFYVQQFPSGPADTFFRLWDGSELISAFANTTTGELPNQVGVFLDFDTVGTGKYVPGDYWTFPVRAGEIKNLEPLVGNAAQRVAPRGIHYHRVALEVLEWSSATAVSAIEDCRHIFHPLTRLATCCSYRVGDGMSSWGDFDSIKDAIAALPREGGEICVLPGEYQENLLIDGKRNITIKGCGSRSRIVPGVLNPNFPIIHISESRNIKIESFSITAHRDGVGLLLEGLEMRGGEGGSLRGITLEKLSVNAARGCAIEAHAGFDITIRECEIEMSDELSDSPGIFLAADDCLIIGNTIRVRSEEERISGVKTLDTARVRRATQGRGGVTIGGASERVRIINNLIQGGTGNGITLGGLAELRAAEIRPIHPGSRTPADPRLPLDLSQQASPKLGLDSTIVSAGALYDIHIEHNLIYNMGANGIGVAAFFDLSKQDEFITVDHLTIAGNEIRHCLGREIKRISSAMENAMGYGGIVLADVEYLVIRDNVIENNGPSHLMPVCGIYVLHGEGIEISRNRILNNGANDGQPSRGALPGPRGGIVISYGIAPRLPFIPRQTFSIPAQNGVPAVKVHDNCVSSPLGQALALIALGPVSVVGNQFTTLGLVQENSSTTWAATVLIFNLGLSNELYTQLLAFSAVARGQVSYRKTHEEADDDNTLFMRKPGLDDAVLGGYLANGNVLFSNNQCMLNLMDQIQEFALSSVLVASLDDISFHGNQCDCDLFLGDFVFTQAILFGISLRVTDNRFKEGVFGAWLSAITIGDLNMTTDNQSTHCLLILGAVVEDQPNTSLLDLFSPKLCAPFHRIGRGFGKPAEPAPTKSTTTTTQTTNTPAKKAGQTTVAPRNAAVTLRVQD